jgi:NADPH-dependent glutamate synthase beta subunit-like oxidoreductase
MSFLCAPWGPSGIEGDIAKSRAEDGKSTKIHYDKPPADKKHICVIGAGASGLTAIKELTALGHKVTCLEMSVRIGGVYTKSYDSTLLTTSSLLTAFSDYSDGLEDRPRFWFVICF